MTILISLSTLLLLMACSFLAGAAALAWMQCRSSRAKQASCKEPS